MKNTKFWKWGGAKSDFVTFAALILLVITVLTLPFAASKYAATGTGSASAGIAKWNVQILSNVSNGAYMKFRQGGATQSHQTTDYVVRVTNNSEVAAVPTLSYVTDSGTGAFTITFQRTTGALTDPVAIGATADYKMTVANTNTVDAFRQIHLKVHVDQVD